MIRIAMLGLTALALAGCQISEGTHLAVKGPETPEAQAAVALAPVAVADVVIVEGPTDRPHTVLGPIKVTVGKLTAFHPNPTRELALRRLQEAAVQEGANGVINVEVSDPKVVATSWGARVVTGTAVRF